MKESFQIQFSYLGTNYAGTVVPGERENDLGYQVDYTMEPGKRFEQSIELCESTTDETGCFEWIQVIRDKRDKGADPGFIQIVGEAIENSEEK